MLFLNAIIKRLLLRNTFNGMLAQPLIEKAQHYKDLYKPEIA